MYKLFSEQENERIRLTAAHLTEQVMPLYHRVYSCSCIIVFVIVIVIIVVVVVLLI